MKYSKQSLGLSLTVFLCIAIMLSGCGGNTKSSEGVSQVKQASVQLEELQIPEPTSGMEIYLRHKKLTDQAKPTTNEVVLFLEPFSVPTAKAFDVEGYSWMDDFAKKGYDTWAMDFRGFGKSTYPKEMDASPQSNKPVVTHQDALKDLTAAVEYIKKKQNVDKVNIVGWSWGAVVGAEYATIRPETVNKLVLYGFMNGFTLPVMTKPFETEKAPGQFNPGAPAYQVIDFDPAMHHWHMMMDNRQLVTQDAWDHVRDVFVDADPTSKNREKNAIRRPMGPLQDLYSIWSNRPLYDLSKIVSPVLVIYGDSDFFAEKKVVDKLTGTKIKKEVVIPEATHWVLYEKNRSKLLEETDQFLKQNQVK
ncbi:alpha/beta hydrolase [Paenibacillus sp. KN14-4R]|uniref:alpha/beta hydrolase n=1 Tax=Paenibacillus sp. KN14-4R TaxID=3445773 RepID=UPI003F9EF378